jgi:hypothetical protein
MESESYRGYSIWGHAIRQQEDILQPERYAASGTITRSNQLIEGWASLAISIPKRKRNMPGLTGLARGSVATVDCRSSTPTLFLP